MKSSLCQSLVQPVICSAHEILSSIGFLALIAGIGLAPVGRLTAQSFTTLHRFTAANSAGFTPFTNSGGAFPRAGLILSGNTLYGTAVFGGSSSNGTVFKVNTDGTGFTTLHNFTGGNDGAGPRDAVVLSGNTLYGTAKNGGSSGNGTVFKVNTDGTGFATLHSFTAMNPNTGANSDGAYPYGGLVLSGDTLFGTTLYGGGSGCGTLFKLNTNDAGLTTLHSFTGSDGAYPYSGLTLSGNVLYGAASQGGTSDNGTVFAVNTNGAGFTILHSFATNAGPFSPNSDGANPVGGLLLSGNTLYGTAADGGMSGNGSVFAVNTDGTGFANLHSFSAVPDPDVPPFINADGATPTGGLLLLGDTLYGTAQVGGSVGAGTVFKVKTDGTGFATLHSFTGGDGANPFGTLISSGETLYGTASSIYANSISITNFGTVFSLSLGPIGAPRLTITPSGVNVTLAWPTNYAGFVYEGNFYDGYTLESTTNLVAPVVWAPVSPGPAVANGQFVVTNSISGSRQFFRLSPPPSCWPAPRSCGYVCINGIWVKNTNCHEYE